MLKDALTAEVLAKSKARRRRAKKKVTQTERNHNLHLCCFPSKCTPTCCPTYALQY